MDPSLRRFDHLNDPVPPPVRPLEIQMLALATGAGLWLGIAQSFAFSNGPVYRYMRTANEWTWAFALLLGALFCAIGIVAAEVRLRKLGLIVIALVWLLMSLCFLAGNPHAFTTWTYVVLAFSAGFASLRL